MAEPATGPVSAVSASSVRPRWRRPALPGWPRAPSPRIPGWSASSALRMNKGVFRLPRDGKLSKLALLSVRV